MTYPNGNGNGREVFERTRLIVTEHRMTSVEAGLDHLSETHETTVQRLEKTNKRLSLHEKAILAIAGSLQVLFQEKFPHLAKIIRGILMP